MKIPEHEAPGCRVSASALTVAVILTIVVGGFVLLTRAIDATHTAARKMSCSNNLKVIGLALQAYHDDHGTFPGSGIYFTPEQSHNPYVWSRSARGSRFVTLLPYIGAADYMWSQVNFDLSGVPTTSPGGFSCQVLPGERRELRSEIIPSYLCPSSQIDPYLNATEPTSSPAMSCYAFSMGAQRMKANGGWCVDYPGNVFGTGSANHGITDKGREVSGVFARRWTGGLSDILDGRSQVILVGEVLPQKGSFFSMGWVYFDSSWAATTAPINFPIIGIGEAGFPGKGDCHHFNNWQTSQAFKSAHQGGASFVYADGSVQFISDEIDYITLQRLGDRRDGVGGGDWNHTRPSR